MKYAILFITTVFAATLTYAESSSCPEKTDQAAQTSNKTISPKLDQLLDKVEQRGASLKSFQADMKFVQKQTLLETEKIRNGDLYYQIKDNQVKFRIHFADLQNRDLEDPQPAPIVKFDEDYAFDGMWFTIRNARLKNLQRRQISKTPAAKEEFRLGKGPFPLPFAIRKKDVIEQFDTTLLPANDKDLKNTDHLLLIPKPKSSFAEEYVRMELWISQKTLVPEQLRFEKENQEFTTITWSHIILDKPIDEKQFEPGPAGDNWTTEDIPIKETQVK